MTLSLLAVLSVIVWALWVYRPLRARQPIAVFKCNTPIDQYTLDKLRQSITKETGIKKPVVLDDSFTVTFIQPGDRVSVSCR